MMNGVKEWGAYLTTLLLVNTPKMSKGRSELAQSRDLGANQIGGGGTTEAYRERIPNKQQLHFSY